VKDYLFWFDMPGEGATVVKVPASHASLVSRPKEVVDLIIAAPESAGK
jgi:hypothetical protein